MCQEENRIMQWCTKPVVNEEAFKLWVGEDEANPETTYVPGEWIKVNLRALKYDFQYRGLLLYAIDAKDEPEGYPNHTKGDPTKLGKWDFTDRQTTFHSYCPRTVLHSDGGLKPYHTSWRFQVPEDFNGQVQFVALIKTGPANMGEFWYPNKVVLSKAATAPVPAGERWYKGAVGESCTEVCQKKEMLCDAPRFGSINSASALQQSVLKHNVCNKPPLLRCGDLDLSFGEDGFCYYTNEQQCDAYKIPVFPDGKANCDSKSDDAQIGARICPCKCDGNKGPCFVPPPTTTTVPSTSTSLTTTTTLPVAPPGTTKPGAPPCTGAPGGCCLPTGECNGNNVECKLLGNTPTCVRKTICVYGDAGCPCTIGSSKCASGLECSPSSVCAASSQPMPGGVDYCADKIGQAGCWCTPAGGCVEANLVPQSNNDGKCYCAVNIGSSGGNDGGLDTICTRGDLGCPCQQQRCKEGGVCRKIGSNTLCLLPDDASSTSLVAPLLAIVVLALAQLF
jgi:hypothetical protein